MEFVKTLKRQLKDAENEYDDALTECTEAYGVLLEAQSNKAAATRRFEAAVKAYISIADRAALFGIPL